MTTVSPGVYKHYKGSVAYVLGVAKHTETGQEMVVYLHPDRDTGHMTYFVRPLDMFLEIVTVAGKKIPRFEKIS